MVIKNNPAAAPSPAAGPVWVTASAPVPYPAALAEMEQRVDAILAGTGPETLWLLEHPPLYTRGTSAREGDLLWPDRFPVYSAGRGGQYTYHGPGQRVVYVMLDLRRRRPDVRWYVHALEEWICRSLAEFSVTGLRRPGRTGVWIDRGGGREDKIAAIGVRLRKWVTFHGIAINVEPALPHFAGIVPCGIADDRLGVTSLVDLGLPVTLQELDLALARTFAGVFDA